MSNWTWEKFREISYISIPEWTARGVNVAFTSRRGGRSEPPYQSLNLGLHVGDQKAAVLENRREVMRVFSCDLNQMICCQQVHSANVILVDQKLSGQGAEDLASALPDCDAMVCHTPGLILATFYADCFPVFIFDPVQRVVALAHSGWKGTMGRIARVVLEKMQAACGSKPEDIEVLIGPGIESCCFIIQAELAARVKQEFPGFNDIIQTEATRITWDLKKTIRQTLIESGCSADNISSCDLCTCCHPELFFSYRRENGNTGRMGAFVGLQY